MAEVTGKLLILDLDETLVYATKDALARQADFQVGPYCIYKRPSVDDFIMACRGLFEVAVWTSASPDYAAGIVAALFPYQLRFVWASDRRTQTYDPELCEHFWVKNLRKVKALGYDLERVIMVDDTAEKHRQNYGNLVQVREWTGDLGDKELLLLLPYLEHLQTAENIRAVEKRSWRSQASILRRFDDGKAPTVCGTPGEQTLDGR